MIKLDRLGKFAVESYANGKLQHGFSHHEIIKDLEAGNFFKKEQIEYLKEKWKDELYEEEDVV